MQYWLRPAGTGAAPITNPDWYAVELEWGRQHGNFSGFRKRPTVEVVPGLDDQEVHSRLLGAQVRLWKACLLSL